MNYINNGSISSDGRTILLKPGEEVKLQVRFSNMEPCRLRYEVDTHESGHVTADGVYTAPARTGSYEIRISSADFPLISTFAYVSVE